jgi:hypothetical protein
MKFSDSVNADETTLTTATITTEKLRPMLKSGNGEQSSITDEEADEEPLVPMLCEAVSRSEVVLRHLHSYNLMVSL